MNSEKTELVSFWVSPELAKQLNEVKNSEKLKEKILKEYVTNETDWLKEEVQGIDEVVLLYKSKLITIRDNFEKVQEIYVDEIVKLIDKTSIAFNPIEEKFKKTFEGSQYLKNQLNDLSNDLNEISKKISYINTGTLERLLDCVERYNKMSEDEKELIKTIINK